MSARTAWDRVEQVAGGGRSVPARYVEPSVPLPVQVRHDGRWLPGWAHGWRGDRVFVRFTDPAASVGFVQWVGAEAVQRRQ